MANPLDYIAVEQPVAPSGEVVYCIRHLHSTRGLCEVTHISSVMLLLSYILFVSIVCGLHCNRTAGHLILEVISFLSVCNEFIIY